jgi:hypothetical protein
LHARGCNFDRGFSLPLASATRAIEKARAILAAIEPLLQDDSAGSA